MGLYEIVEKKRLALQNELDLKKSPKERNALGQFATPFRLANDIIDYILKNNFFVNETIHFLDPAIGTGAFFSAIINKSSNGSNSKIDSAMGIEIDVGFAEASKKLWSDYGLQVITGDFTRIDPPQDNNELANLILTNPPYVRHHHIDKDTKKRLIKLIKNKFGYGINGLSGLYGYFLLLSHFWLREGGYGIWLVPSEFMDVNYGKTLKQYLTEQVTLLHIHRFDPNEIQFGDALVSSAIIVFRKEKPTTGTKILFTFGGSLLGPGTEQILSIEEIKNHPKWTHFPISHTDPVSNYNNETIRLKDIFKIKRGIATGNNKFFIMDKRKASSLSLPDEFLTPILPGPRDLKDDIIESDGEGNPLLNDQLVILNCDIPEQRIKTAYPGLYNYLKSGELECINNGYLLRKRNPWYKQEYREPAPFLCTYMGRSNGDKRPFRFIWNKSKAITANVYLLLYPTGEFARALNKNHDLYNSVFEALNRVESEELMGNGRVYGGGLHKIEPKELGNISAINLLDTLSSINFNISNQTKLSNWSRCDV